MKKITLSVFTFMFLVIMVPISGFAQVDGEQNTPVIAYDPDTGYYLSVYVEWIAGITQVWGKVIDAAGKVKDTGIIFHGPPDNYNPDLSYDSKNRVFLVVWEHNVIGDADIYGKYVKVNPNGTMSFRPGSEPQTVYDLVVNCEDDPSDGTSGTSTCTIVRVIDSWSYGKMIAIPG